MIKTLESPQEIGLRSWTALYNQIKGYKEHSVFKFSGFSQNQICDYQIDAQTVYENALNEINEIGIDYKDASRLIQLVEYYASVDEIEIDEYPLYQKLVKLKEIL